MGNAAQPDARPPADADPLVGGSRSQDLLEQRLLRDPGRPRAAPSSGRSVAGKIVDGGLEGEAAIGQGDRLGRTERRWEGRRDADRRRPVLDVDRAWRTAVEEADDGVDGAVDPELDGEVDRVVGGITGVVSLVRMATPPMPSRSATAFRARGLATSTTPAMTMAAAASASTRRTAGRWTSGVTDAGRSSSAMARSGMSDAAGNSRLSASSASARSRSASSTVMRFSNWSRRRSSLRRRDFTVPAGTSSAAAVSASDRPAK